MDPDLPFLYLTTTLPHIDNIPVLVIVYCLGGWDMAVMKILDQPRCFYSLYVIILLLAYFETLYFPYRIVMLVY